MRRRPAGRHGNSASWSRGLTVNPEEAPPRIKESPHVFQDREGDAGSTMDRVAVQPENPL